MEEEKLNVKPEIEIEHSANLNEIFAALSKAQSTMKPAIKDSNNPFFKSKYADLAGVWESCIPELTANGLCVIQSVVGKKEECYLITWLGHKSGQYIRSKAPILTSKLDSQSVGSAITYMRRYCLSATTGVVQEDDDGEASMNRNKKEVQEFKVTQDQLEALYNSYGVDKELFAKFFLESMKLRGRDQSAMYTTCMNHKKLCDENFAQWKLSGPTLKK